MSRCRFALLIFELFLFALILVLPQVDLPDFTFPGGTAPVVAKSRLSPPAVSIPLAPVQALSLGHIRQTGSDSRGATVHVKSNSPVSVDCILRC